MKIKVITHDGTFHADEIFAIAILIQCGIIPSNILDLDKCITRTRDTNIISLAKKSTDYFVLDVGGEHNPDMLNFDHHQDLDIPATNELVTHWLYDQNYISEHVYNHLSKHIMYGIGAYDCNYNNIHASWLEFNAVAKMKHINALITAFNDVDIYSGQQLIQFYDAIYFALKIIENEIKAAIEEQTHWITYNNGKIIDDFIVFDKFCRVWKQTKEFIYAIMPQSDGNQWNLVTRDSKEYPLVNTDHDDLIFVHGSKFIAGYKSKEAAIEVAKRQRV